MTKAYWVGIVDVKNQEEYIMYLNWLPNWFSVYFIGKFSDYLLVIIFLIIVLLLGPTSYIFKNSINFFLWFH